MRLSLERMLSELDDMERSAQMDTPLHFIDARAKIIVTLLFIATLLSTSLTRLSELMMYTLYPILLAACGGFSFPRIFCRSLVVLPFVVFIGVFNIFYDTVPSFRVGHIVVSRGWVTFTAIILRALLSVQAVLLLMNATGCYNLCRGLQRMGCPSIVSSLLFFIYRYIYVLLQEALKMSRAVEARSFGRKSYPLKVWGQIVGQLMIRTFDRARVVGQAMAARGFNVTLPTTGRYTGHWNRRDSLFTGTWCVFIVLLRFFHPAEVLFRHLL